MKLIVGLGNPGEEYKNTRHNIGFMVIDEMASKYNVVFKNDKSLKGMVAQININGSKAILLKPQTYMNLSGDSVILVKNYYKIDIDDIIVVNDDLDMPVGKLRCRPHGSAGGHNGLKSIIANLGTENFKRLKVGIDRSKVIPVVDWVLGKFKDEDKKLLNNSIDKAIIGLETFILDNDFNKVANKINA